MKYLDFAALTAFWNFNNESLKNSKKIWSRYVFRLRSALLQICLRERMLSSIQDSDLGLSFEDITGATESKTSTYVELSLNRNSSALKSQWLTSTDLIASQKANEKALLIVEVINQEWRVSWVTLCVLETQGTENKTDLWSENPLSNTSRSYREKPFASTRSSECPIRWVGTLLNVFDLEQHVSFKKFVMCFEGR